MIAEKEQTIIEKVRSWKEQNAAISDFDIDRIIASAQQREGRSDHVLLEPPSREDSEQPDTHHQHD
ncbi:MAG: hypothetical protein AAF226_03450 [Verrucomicrobiota bacterium]